MFALYLYLVFFSHTMRYVDMQTALRSLQRVYDTVHLCCHVSITQALCFRCFSQLEATHRARPHMHNAFLSGLQVSVTSPQLLLPSSVARDFLSAHEALQLYRYCQLLTGPDCYHWLLCFPSPKVYFLQFPKRR